MAHGPDTRTRWTFTSARKLAQKLVNGYLNYKSLNPDNKLSHLEFRHHVVHGLVGTFTSRRASFPAAAIKRKAPAAVVYDHLPQIMPGRKRCKLCHQRGTENRSRFQCNTCGAALCLQSDRNSRTFTLSNCQTYDRERFSIKLFDM